MDNQRRTKPGAEHLTKPAPPVRIKPDPDHDTKPDPHPNRKTLMQCGPRCCRWPISNSQPWFYCGSPTDGETAYCETHREQRRASPEPVDQQARRFINMYGRIK